MHTILTATKSYWTSKQQQLLYRYYAFNTFSVRCQRITMMFTIGDLRWAVYHIVAVCVTDNCRDPQHEVAVNDNRLVDHLKWLSYDVLRHALLYNHNTFVIRTLHTISWSVIRRTTFSPMVIQHRWFSRPSFGLYSLASTNHVPPVCVVQQCTVPLKIWKELTF